MVVLGREVVFPVVERRERRRRGEREVEGWNGFIEAWMAERRTSREGIRMSGGDDG